MLAVHEIYYSLCEAHRYFGNPEKAIPYFKTTLKRAKVKKDKATAAFCQEYIFNCRILERNDETRSLWQLRQ